MDCMRQRSSKSSRNGRTRTSIDTPASLCTETILKDGSIARMVYGKECVSERHRHRYEVNIEYVPELEAKGCEFVGRDTKGERMEIFELQGHPFMIGAQYHPEFKSRPLKPSPLFYGLICASAGIKPVLPI